MFRTTFRLRQITRTATALGLAALATASTQAGGNIGPQISSLSETTLPRSGRLLIFGSNFGAQQGTSQVLIDGLEAITTTWANAEIHAYVPEAATVGAVLVQVETAAGSSNAMMLDVMLRQSDGRVQWRFQTDDYVPLQFVARGPDGTIYVSDWVGLYALSPDGALLWFAADAGGGRPISFGADGTIYTGGAPGTLVWALNPDGAPRWTIPNDGNLQLLAGPNVGPDGNIYAVQDSDLSLTQGLGMFSVDPDGNVLFSNIMYWSNAGGNSEITFGDGQFYAGWQFNPSAPVSTKTFDMSDGSLLWDSGDVGVSALGLPILDSLGRLMLSWAGAGTVAVTPQGNYDWITTHPGGSNSVLQSAMGASGTAYSGKWLGVELWAFDPDGNTIWVAPDNSHMLHRVTVSPDELQIVATGTAGFGQPQWVRGHDTADGALIWHVELPPENGVNQFSSAWQTVFTPDSLTAYVASGFVGDVNEYGYLYALDVPFDPALDGDGDGYPDNNDNCPNVPNEDQTDSDGDGVGDACDFIPDACVDAIEMCPGTVSGSTVGATNDGLSSCSPNAHLNRDVWYSYTPPVDGTVTVDGCGAASSYYLSVHTGCPGTVANEVGCALYGCPSGPWPQVTFNATAGQTYLIRVTGFLEVEIDYTLTLSGPSCNPDDVDGDGVPNDADNCPNHANPAQEDCDGDGVGDVCAIATGQSADCNEDGVPDECQIPTNDCNGNGGLDACDIADGVSADCNANGVPDECESFPDCINDFCEGATPLCPGSVSGSTAQATGDGSALCGLSSDSPDVWYAYIAGANGQATVSTCGSWYDTVLSVHSGCPGTTANQIACNDDGGDCGDFESSITFGVVAGETYLVRVSGFNGDAGDFTLTFTGPECQNDPQILADLTGPGGVPDGCVDAFDLGAMLGAWCSGVNDRNPPSPPCENCTPANLAVADISGSANVPDGCVDAFDLAKLLAEWCSVAGGNPCGTCGP